LIEEAALDERAWASALDGFGDGLRDVYFTPDYHALHRANGDGEPSCDWFQRGAARLLVPGLRTAIPGGRGFDLQTCNGYGGPIAAGDDRAFLDEAWARWRSGAAARGVVAALFRLHPLADNARFLPSDARVIDDRSTVFVELAAGVDAAFAAADSRHRNMVSKARRAGVVAAWSAPGAWPDFERLYGEAMQRLAAPPSLRFGSAYFAALQKNDWAELATIADERGLCAAAVFLWGPRWAHYHLSARRGDAPNYATNVLLQAALERAAERRLAGLHLGGGTTTSPDDPLLRFKRSLGGRLLQYRVALVVADAAAYAALVADWTRVAGRAPSWLLGYRQPR